MPVLAQMLVSLPVQEVLALAGEATGSAELLQCLCLFVVSLKHGFW